MDTACSIALDTLSLVYMGILIFNLKYKHKREPTSYQYFQITILVCLFLALDIIYMMFYSSTQPLHLILLKIVKSLYFVVNSAIVWVWVKYIDCTVFQQEYKTKKHRFFYTGIFIVNTLIVIINFFTGILFDISPDGTFVATPVVMWCFTLLNYLSIFISVLVLLKAKKTIARKSFLPLLLFPLPPFIGELIQILFRPCSLICTYAVSALIIFQLSQNNTIYTDELTGLANRRLINESLCKWIGAPKGEFICGIMLDLDGLKYINDTYGHLSGDNALITLSGIIKAVRRRDMIAARYGGDEFILIWLSNDASAVFQAAENLTAEKQRINNMKPPAEKIDFSTGAFSCCDKECPDAAWFLKEIDNRMYACKKEKRKTNQ